MTSNLFSPRHFGAALLCLALCPFTSSALADDEVWPEERWERQDPAAAGLDAAKLEEALALAREHHSKAVVIVHQGRVVAERYWDGWDADTTGPLYSATKSVISVLVGIALEEGAIQGLDESCADFLPEWREQPQAAIQVRHLLSMTSGLELGNPGLMILKGAAAKDDRVFATALEQEHPPGTVWGYHNPAYHLLFSLLAEASGVPLPDYARSRLFEPLGITSAHFETKRGRRRGYKFLSCTARDLARFGLLVLRGGRWGARQVVPAAYLQEATQPSQTLNPCYGYLFWLNAGDSYRLPNLRYEDDSNQGPLLPHCPRDVVAALGAKDQKCYVVPSLDLVVVRLGDAASRGRAAASKFDDPFLSTICAAVPAGE